MANWLQTHSTEIQAISAFVIALATVVYVVVTCFLWRATKRSADAAKLAADAAKKSSDIGAALHRPYLGVPILTRHNNYNEEVWAIRWQVKNFGTLSASDVMCRLEFLRNGKPLGNPTGRGPWEIFPQSDTEEFVEISVDRETHDNLYTRNWSLTAHIGVTYLAPGGTRYQHGATFVYDRTTQNFRLENSETNAHHD